MPHFLRIEGAVTKKPRTVAGLFIVLDQCSFSAARLRIESGPMGVDRRQSGRQMLLQSGLKRYTTFPDECARCLIVGPVALPLVLGANTVGSVIQHCCDGHL